MMNKIRLGLVGCGAIMEQLHLQAAQVLDDVEIVAFVDPDRQRSLKLQQRAQTGMACADAAEISALVDAVILAPPHALHASLSLFFLEKGISVLVEKPMATTEADCDRMIAAACSQPVVLAPGMIRRYYPVNRWIKAAVAANLPGHISTVSWNEGNPYSWEAASTAMLHPETGGGVLTGTAIHALDLLCWWFGPWTDAAYSDDAQGGVEAECRVRLTFANGTVADCHFSRLRQLQNRCIMRGSNATLECGIFPDTELLLTPAGTTSVLCGQPQVCLPQTLSIQQLFQAQLQDFVQAVRDERAPFVTGADGKNVVRLLQECKAGKQDLEHPWLRSAATTADHDIDTGRKMVRKAT